LAYRRFPYDETMTGMASSQKPKAHLGEVPARRGELVDRVVQPILVGQRVRRARLAVLRALAVALRPERVSARFVGVAADTWQKPAAGGVAAVRAPGWRRRRDLEVIAINACSNASFCECFPCVRPKPVLVK
jgi:hypothetical protein